MHVLRHAHEVSAFLQSDADPDTADLIQRRLEELGVGSITTMEEIVFFVVLGSQDTLIDLQSVLGADARLTDGPPLWEVIEAHSTCFEAVFVLASSGYGALVLAPFTQAHPDVLAWCRCHAIPTARPTQ